MHSGVGVSYGRPRLPMELQEVEEEEASEGTETQHEPAAVLFPAAHPVSHNAQSESPRVRQLPVGVPDSVVDSVVAADAGASGSQGGEGSSGADDMAARLKMLESQV